MKSTQTFVLAFVATLLLLFAQAFFAGIFDYVGMAVVAILFLGGFVWLFLHVVRELLGQFKGRRTKVLALVSLLALFGLTAVLSVFYIWTFLVAFVLFCCLVWRGIQDFGDIFRPHQPLQGPHDWRALEQSQLPPMNSETVQHAKERFAHSCVLHVNYTPRTGALGLSGHPLKMDE